MKTSLDQEEHLPEHKKREIKTIVEMITKASSKVEMVILFGSYARGDWKEEKDISPDAPSGTASDYDILVIVSEEQACHDGRLLRLERDILRARFTTYARLLLHDIDYVNQKLRIGQYFFSEIIEQGILLYDSKKFKLDKKRKLSPGEIYQKAKDYFDAGWESAEEFWFGYKMFSKAKMYNKASFNMHQACETLLKTFLLMTIDNSPQGHFLKDLGELAGNYRPEMNQVFPYQTEEEQERFDRLDYSYIGARYNAKFKMTKEELLILQPYVEKLFALTKSLCEERLEKLKEKMG